MKSRLSAGKGDTSLFTEESFLTDGHANYFLRVGCCPSFGFNCVRIGTIEATEVTPLKENDGPGLRLVVFLQGCPFRCLYCANPDTIDVKGGTPTTPEEILQMAISQKAFFGKKGGITFSGGEPTLQAEALIPLFKELKANGIHICLDSNGGIWNEKVEELFSLTDLVLLDIKQFNPERHRTLTGRSNEQTLRTAAWLEEHEHPFWLRYVLVPGYSDSEEDTRLLGESLGKYQQIQRVEILPYHRLGVHKYEAMGWDYKLKEVKENTPEQLERAEKLFKEYFTNVITN